MHLTSTRGAPSPDRGAMIKALAEHQKLRCTQPEPASPDRLELMFTLGGRIAQRVNKQALSRSALSSEHLSVSNSSCYERSRSKGGRASYVREQIHLFANEVSKEAKEETLILGHKVSTRVGIPYWKTFTPIEPLTLREEEPQTAFGDPIQSDQFMQKYAGFGKNTGYLLLQWAFEEGVKAKVLSRDLKVIGAFRQRAIPLGEPGDKTRCLTVDPAWVTLLLTPFGHILVDTLRTIPEAAAGLGFGEPAFRFLQRLSKTAQRMGNDRIFLEYGWFLSMDLDKATDHFHREKARHLLRGYIHGLGKDFENPYNLMCIDLLTSERICVWSLGGSSEHNHETDT